MGKRCLSENYDDIVLRYLVHLEPMASIAKHYGMTRQAVYYALKRAGVDTTKESNGHITAVCDHCGLEYKQGRASFRKQNHHFCSNECYWAWLDRKSEEGFPYIDSPRGRDRSRAAVEKRFKLSDGNIVHHEDRNQNNDEISNLKVFANSADHLRYHRGIYVKPIWDGSEYPTISIE